MDTFKEQYHGDTESVVRRILQEWLEGKGLPVTWGSLIKALKGAKLFCNGRPDTRQLELILWMSCK